MMLARMALRMMTMMALTNGRAATYPTLAGNEVHDTAIRQIDQADPDQYIALVTVFTDDSQADNERSGADFEAGEIACSLNIECAFVIRKGKTDEHGFEYPHTEPELEAKLDILEKQVLSALFEANTFWARGWRNLVVRTVNLTSNRVHSDDSGVKLAIRQTALQLAIRPDCPPDLAPSNQLPVDLTAVFAAAPAATQEQRDLLTNRMLASQQVPMPLQLVVQEIEKASWVRENTGGDAIQEAETLRTQILANAPDGPLKAIGDLSDTNYLPDEGWQLYITLDTYLTEVSVGSNNADPHGYAINPMDMPVDDMASVESANGYGSWSILTGAWAYVLNTAHAAVSGLATNEKLTDYFDIVKNDGGTIRVTVTIIGE